MSETKFTPGPWYPGHLGSDGKCQCRSVFDEGHAGGICLVEVDNGKPISEGGNDAPPLEEAIANMHLIGQAPSLYAKLQEIRKWMDADICGPWDAKFTKEIDDLLARARGEQ